MRVTTALEGINAIEGAIWQRPAVFVVAFDDRDAFTAACSLV
jgi:hypothetical protein